MNRLLSLILLSTQALALLNTGCSDRNIKVTNLSVGSAPPPKIGELSIAVAAGAETQVQELIAKGADVDENIGTKTQPITPLMIALGLSDVPNDKMAAYLLDQHANPDIDFYSTDKSIKMSIREWICVQSQETSSAELHLTKNALSRRLASND